MEITAYAPPAEAYARLAFALTEVRKYLIPDSNDNIRQQQMRELEIISTGVPGALARMLLSEPDLLLLEDLDILSGYEPLHPVPGAAPPVGAGLGVQLQHVLGLEAQHLEDGTLINPALL